MNDLQMYGFITPTRECYAAATSMRSARDFFPEFDLAGTVVIVTDFLAGVKIEKPQRLIVVPGETGLFIEAMDSDAGGGHNA